MNVVGYPCVSEVNVAGWAGANVDSAAAAAWKRIPSLLSSDLQNSTWVSLDPRTLSLQFPREQKITWRFCKQQSFYLLTENLFRTLSVLWFDAPERLFIWLKKFNFQKIFKTFQRHRIFYNPSFDFSQFQHTFDFLWSLTKVEKKLLQGWLLWNCNLKEDKNIST